MTIMADKVHIYVDIPIHYVRLKLHRHGKILTFTILPSIYARYVTESPIYSLYVFLYIIIFF